TRPAAGRPAGTAATGHRWAASRAVRAGPAGRSPEQARGHPAASWWADTRYADRATHRQPRRTAGRRARRQVAAPLVPLPAPPGAPTRPDPRPARDLRCPPRPAAW